MIYLDYNATTPCLPEVVEAMIPYFTEKFGNASSVHYPIAWQSKYAVDKARTQVAELVGVEPAELIFTSGSTEACYLGIRGLLELFKSTKKDFTPHVITSQLEHSAVTQVLKDAERQGLCMVTWISSDPDGKISVEDIKKVRHENTVLIALMLANNVTGVLTDVASIGAWAREQKIFTFCDTTQAIGKIPLSFKALNVDMACISAHKFYGPKGIGCLYLKKDRPAVRIQALMSGGGQENQIRGGTLNVPAIVGMGVAAEMAQSHIQLYQTSIQALRDRMEAEVKSWADVHFWGQASERLPHVSMIGVKGFRAVDIIHQLKGKYAFSLGSACQAHENKPSYVIQAMRPESEYIEGSVRFSLGIYTQQEDIDALIKDLKQLLSK